MSGSELDLRWLGCPDDVRDQLRRALAGRVVGAWPGALQFTAHGRRDAVLMALDLHSTV